MIGGLNYWSQRFLIFKLDQQQTVALSFAFQTVTMNMNRTFIDDFYRVNPFFELKHFLWKENKGPKISVVVASTSLYSAGQLVLWISNDIYCVNLNHYRTFWTALDILNMKNLIFIYKQTFTLQITLVYIYMKFEMMSDVSQKLAAISMILKFIFHPANISEESANNQRNVSWIL